MYKTLIVVDDETLDLGETALEIIGFERYLREYPKRNESKIRIINLCDTSHYLSKGYYCSLLAEARDHTVLPSVKTINQLRNLTPDNEQFLALAAGLKLPSPADSAMVYFGASEQPELHKLSARAFAQYPAPLLKLDFNEDGSLASIRQHSFIQLDDEEQSVFLRHLAAFIRTVWRIGARKKRYRWDMAILLNAAEKVPPSNKEAIARFIKAAGKHGILAEAVEASQLTNLASFDALFIRETTAIDHHTYRLACRAEDQGLVVIDDPQSILRCCNKVFLHDAFMYQRVPSLKTLVIGELSAATTEQIEREFSYPLVLKMPEGSFSRGVFKVENRSELNDRVGKLLAESALVLVQEYLYTNFDWRIGVLNGRAIYACKYLMARNHWQIYNHDAKRFVSGDFETLATFEAPKVVLDAALKAAKIIGSGLYGVDVKEVSGKAYVLEVNDNPSIDHKVEDLYLGDELYMQIMGEFQRRLEARGR